MLDTGHRTVQWLLISLRRGDQSISSCVRLSVSLCVCVCVHLIRDSAAAWPAQSLVSYPSTPASSGTVHWWLGGTLWLPGTCPLDLI